MDGWMNKGRMIIVNLSNLHRPSRCFHLVTYLPNVCTGSVALGTIQAGERAVHSLIAFASPVISILLLLSLRIRLNFPQRIQGYTNTCLLPPRSDMENQTNNDRTWSLLVITVDALATSYCATSRFLRSPCDVLPSRSKPSTCASK